MLSVLFSWGAVRIFPFANLFHYPQGTGTLFAFRDPLVINIRLQKLIQDMKVVLYIVSYLPSRFELRTVTALGCPKQWVIRDASNADGEFKENRTELIILHCVYSDGGG